MGRRGRSAPPQLVPEDAAQQLIEKLLVLMKLGYLCPDELDWLRGGLKAVSFRETELDEQRHRNLWVAIDFRAHSGMPSREKTVAKRWNLNPRQVATIGTRYKAKAADLMDSCHTLEEWRRIVGHIAPLFQ